MKEKDWKSMYHKIKRKLELERYETSRLSKLTIELKKEIDTLQTQIVSISSLLKSVSKMMEYKTGDEDEKIL